MALRFYESLDADCQQDWERLQSAMAEKFPRGLRDGGRARLSADTWKRDGLRTRPKGPPTTRSSAPFTGQLLQKELENEGSQSGLGKTEDAVVKNVTEQPELQSAVNGSSSSKMQERTRTTSLALKDGPSIRFLSRGLSSTSAPEDPHIIVQSLILKSIVTWYFDVIAEVRLDDLEAVTASQTVPLTTVSVNESKILRAGFAFTVLGGTRDIEFCHKIIEPRSLFRTTHVEQVGTQSISPRGGLSEVHWVTDLIFKPKTPRKFDKGMPRGKYIIQSYVRSREPGTGRPGRKNPPEIAGSET
ncbi:hypothetical protein FRB90_003245 [Tulasnella sp. 427]|nr:hypothetical protein FRB90_003245 [Tulasnella sp. 427]